VIEIARCASLLVTMTNNAPPSPDVPGVVEHLFRHESAKMVATLARIFGLEHLTLAEDVVQEALARALQTWPFYGIPENPSAWIMRTSRNLALDTVRRQKTFRGKEAEIIRMIEGATPDVSVFTEQEIADDRLRLMFACCHPQVPEDSQAVVALKVLCGFGIEEISRAFLTTEAAIAKRLTRARQRIREAKIPFEIPAGPELACRLDGVLRTIYLLFNEGYKASSGDRLVREDICDEAIRLAALLAQHAVGDQPKTHALLALMLLNGARFPTRTDEEGDLLLLKDQDRSQWDRPLIARGMYHLSMSAAGGEITEYHLQAGIAACHIAAGSYEATDWRRILALYDALARFDDSPVVALNRAIAVANLHGPGAGIDAVNAIQHRDRLQGYYLFHAVLGEFELLQNHGDAAAGHYRAALKLAGIESERRFLAKKIEACGVAAPQI
jgi:RNA polymerase sigma factor (sigma-70 family)